MTVVDIASNTVSTTVAVGAEPYYVAITPNGRYAYVTEHNSDTVSVIDTSSNTVFASVAVGIFLTIWRSRRIASAFM